MTAVAATNWYSLLGKAGTVVVNSGPDAGRVLAGTLTSFDIQPGNGIYLLNLSGQIAKLFATDDITASIVTAQSTTIGLGVAL